MRAETGEAKPALLVACMVGVVSRPPVEYLLHRFLGHDPRTRPNLFAAEHTRRHSEDYFAPAWKKALVAAAGVVVLGAVASLVAGAMLGLAAAVSFTAMYVTYEVVHRRLHTRRPTGALGRFLRRHHFHHHFVNPRTNHGVTSPLWDVVFGTRQRAGRIRVPERLAPAWLRDAEGHGRLTWPTRTSLWGRAAPGRRPRGRDRPRRKRRPHPLTAAATIV